MEGDLPNNNNLCVYVAGPITLGDLTMNVRKGMVIGDWLLNNGFSPFIPHLTHFWHLLFPHEIDRWYAYDKQWLGRCDCLIRLPGESKGADAEVEFAKDRGIKVFRNPEQFALYFGIDDCPET